jgi:predicted nucleotidyltransferase
MPNETPKFFVDKVREQKEDDPRPYDALIHLEKDKERVGFVQDNFVCEVVDEKGGDSTIRIPTAITYFKGQDEKQWHKKLYGYHEGIKDALDSEEMNYYVVYDPSSGLSFLAMPLDDNTKMTCGKDNLNLFLSKGLKEDTESLTKLIAEFKDVNFGLFGSRSFLDSIATKISDIDLVVYGPKDLERIVSAIEGNKDLCKKIGLTGRSSGTIEKYVLHYMKKFNITETEARIMTLRKRRYILEPNIKLSFNCALLDGESGRKVPMAVGSRKIHDITIEASALDTSMSSALPRVFSVETEGQKIDVVTSTWSLKDFIRPGDKVKIKGALRESDGVTFISLEKPGDIIIPITNDKQ